MRKTKFKVAKSKHLDFTTGKIATLSVFTFVDCIGDIDIKFTRNVSSFLEECFLFFKGTRILIS